MLRLVTGNALRALAPRISFSAIAQSQQFSRQICCAMGNGNLLNWATNLALSQKPLTYNVAKPSVTSPQIQPVRTVTKFSLKKGKRKAVKAVVKRFKRLDWGIWIRTHSGRHKKLFKKSPALKRRLRQHIFTNATQSWLLDKMVTSFWRRPKHYIDDPYEPYHKRDEYFATKSKTLKV